MQNPSTRRFLAQVYNNLGVIYSERNDYQRARAEYETAVQFDRWLPAAWYKLGKDLQKQGQLKATERYAFSIVNFPKAKPTSTPLPVPVRVRLMSPFVSAWASADLPAPACASDWA